MLQTTCQIFVINDIVILIAIKLIKKIECAMIVTHKTSQPNSACVHEYNKFSLIIIKHISIHLCN